MTFENLLEEIRKPTKKELEKHKSKKPNGGNLHWMVTSEKGKPLGYIDDEYIKKINAKNPRHAAHIRLGQVERFKKMKG